MTTFSGELDENFERDYTVSGGQKFWTSTGLAKLKAAGLWDGVPPSPPVDEILTGAAAIDHAPAPRSAGSNGALLSPDQLAEKVSAEMQSPVRRDTLADAAIIATRSSAPLANGWGPIVDEINTAAAAARGNTAKPGGGSKRSGGALSPAELAAGVNAEAKERGL